MRTLRMPYRPISKDIKDRALFLLAEGWIPEDVMEIFGVSASSLYRWRHNLEQYGSVVPPPNPTHGRPRLLTADQTDAVLSFLDECAARYLDEIMEWLAVHHEVAIGRSTLHAIIRDAGYTYKALRRKAAERNPESQEQFRQLQANHLTARMCICVDESSKDDRTIYRHFGWSAAGQRATIDADFTRGDRWSILPAMTVDGYIAVRVVPGSVDGAEFFDFITTDVVGHCQTLHAMLADDQAQLPHMNAYPGERSVLILDNCAIHKSEALREVVEAVGT